MSTVARANVDSEAKHKTRGCGPLCEQVEKRPGCLTASLNVIGDKWTPFLVARLLGKSHTFGELLELLPGISPRTLSARLHKLEHEKIITREQYALHPVRYRYALTTKGRELTEILTHMAKWGEKYCS
jgi:DNA-binding HxlR family transcriptional regulator